MITNFLLFVFMCFWGFVIGVVASAFTELSRSVSAYCNSATEVMNQTLEGRKAAQEAYKKLFASVPAGNVAGHSLHLVKSQDPYDKV